MHFIILAIVLAIGAGFVVPFVNKTLAGAAPSLTSSPMIALLITGVILAATVWAGHEILGKEIKS